MDPPDPPQRAPSASGLASPGHRFPLESWQSQRGPWVSRGSRPNMEALELLAGRAPEAGSRSEGDGTQHENEDIHED